MTFNLFIALTGLLLAALFAVVPAFVRAVRQAFAERKTEQLHRQRHEHMVSRWRDYEREIFR